MMQRKWLGICVLACATLGRAETKWIHMQSPNFQVYSEAGEAGTRDTLRYFERVRDFFLQAANHAPLKPVPVYVVIFGSEKEYAPYRFNEFAAAYYHPAADRDYIVMGKAGEETARIATHEYVHLITRHDGLNFPPWFGEGMAEVFSTFQSFGDKVIVGAVIPGRLQALVSEKWVPLATILAADHASPYYNEKNKAGNLYNEGWALVHMLWLTPEYRPKWPELWAKMVLGTPSVEAVEKTYGKPLAAIEKDLQEYVRGNRFRVVQFPVKLETSKEQFPASPAPMFDVKLALLNLVSGPSAAEEVPKRLTELKQEDPARPEPWSALGYLAWGRQNVGEAVEDFAQAYQRGGRSTKFLFDYGRLLQNGHADDAAKILKELLTIEPENKDARMELAAAHLSASRPGQALVELLQIERVDPDQAPRFFTIDGFARMQMGDREGARIAATKLAEIAKTPQDRSQAERLQTYLGEADARAALVGNLREQPVAESPTEAAAPPRLVRRVEESLSSLSGSLVEVNCGAAEHSFAIGTAQGKKIFVVDEKKGVNITGRETEFSCGAQKPAPSVKIEFVPVTDRAGIDGVVRAIHFEP